MTKEEGIKRGGKNSKKGGVSLWSGNRHERKVISEGYSDRNIGQET